MCRDHPDLERPLLGRTEEGVKPPNVPSSFNLNETEEPAPTTEVRPYRV